MTRARKTTPDHPLNALITQDEAHFAEMGLEFVDTQEGLALSDLQDLFLKVGGGGAAATAGVGEPRASGPLQGLVCIQRQPASSAHPCCSPRAPSLLLAGWLAHALLRAGRTVHRCNRCSPCVLLLPQVGFAKRDPLRLKVAIENTYHLIWIRATKPVRGGTAEAGPVSKDPT